MAYIFQKVRLSKEMNAYYARDIQMSFRYFNQEFKMLFLPREHPLPKSRFDLSKDILKT